MIIKDSITETQNVQFILDKDKNLKHLNDINFSEYNRSIIICDSNLKYLVWPLVKKNISNRIEISKVEFIDAKESSKDLQTYSKLVEILCQIGFTRYDIIIAIGGGIVLDIVSFLASTYMRGIDLLMIPTTLIGQADASTAGKTCLNASSAKNILGTLYLPKYVYNNITLLKTNSKYHLRQGFSEIFKYALLGSEKLLKLLFKYKNHNNEDTLLEILKETIAVRLTIRKRHVLASNFGHTFGHAFEKYSNFAVGHGDAISVGMLIALDYSLEEKLINKDLFNHIFSMMKELELNTKINSGIDSLELTKIMLKDKKSSNKLVRLVLIEDIVKPLYTNNDPFYSVKPKKMERFLLNILNDNKYIEDNHWIKLAQGR